MSNLLHQFSSGSNLSPKLRTVSNRSNKCVMRFVPVVVHPKPLSFSNNTRSLDNTLNELTWMPTISIRECLVFFPEQFWKVSRPKNIKDVSNLHIPFPVINSFSSSLTTTTYCSRWDYQITVPLRNSTAR